MTDKERIEKLLITMVHLERAVDLVINCKTCSREQTEGLLIKVKKMINFVIDKNTDQIELPADGQGKD